MYKIHNLGIEELNGKFGIWANGYGWAWFNSIEGALNALKNHAPNTWRAISNKGDK